MARLAPLVALAALAALAVLPAPAAGASLAGHHDMARRDDLHHRGALAPRRVRKRCAAPDRTTATSAASPAPDAANVEGAPPAGSVTAGAPIDPAPAPTTDSAASTDAATTDTAAETAPVTTASSASTTRVRPSSCPAPLSQTSAAASSAANVQSAPSAPAAPAAASSAPAADSSSSDTAASTSSSDTAATTSSSDTAAATSSSDTAAAQSSSAPTSSSSSAAPASSSTSSSAAPPPDTSTSTSTTPKSTSTTPKAPASSSAAPAPTVTATSGGGGNKKVGLLWDNAIPGALPQWKSAKVGGLYNWSPSCPASAKDAGIPCFPMLWGDKDTDGWLDTVVEGYATLALGPNEVNQPGQAQMNVSHGADLWRTYMQPLVARGYELASPSVSSASSGIPWLVDWMNSCPDCWASTTYAVVHYYGTDAQAFIAYLNAAHTALNKDLMVTEMACEDFGSGPQCSQSDVFAFLDTVTAFMDATPWVHMYFWFGLVVNLGGGVSQVNGMMNGDGSPNQLGLDYLS